MFYDLIHISCLTSSKEASLKAVKLSQSKMRYPNLWCLPVVSQSGSWPEFLGGKITQKIRDFYKEIPNFSVISPRKIQVMTQDWDTISLKTIEYKKLLIGCQRLSTSQKVLKDVGT